MRRNYTNDDFEQFIRQNADQFRLNPSPDVWEGIQSGLTKRKSSFLAFTISTLIALTATGFFLWNGGKIHIPANHTPITIYKPADHFTFNPGSNYKLKETNATPFEPTIALINNKGGLIAFNNSIATQTNAFEKVGEESNKPEKEKIKAQKLLMSAYLSSGLLYEYPNRNRQPMQLDTKAVVKNKKPQEPATSRLKLKPSNFEYQLFATPAISYRKLGENKSYLHNAFRLSQSFNINSLYNINNAVVHKPDLGLAFGALAKYKLTRNFKVRAGLQFNINRYSIKAFSYVPEVATIALNNSFWPDSLNTIARYRNFNGNTSNWLENMYFQISAPLGAEYEFKSSKKTAIGISGSIQPTYLIGDRVYLITADYKNYARVPSLVRRWNVNTNVETFVSFKGKGNTTWQIGPQLRYQLMSSFVTKYPVKENLFDFGVKIAVTLHGKQPKETNDTPDTP